MAGREGGQASSACLELRTGCDVTNYGSDERKGAGTGCGVTKYDSDEWKGGGDWH